MVKIKLKKLRFYNEDKQEFQDIPYAHSWTYDVDDMEERLSLLKENRDEYQGIQEWFSTLMHQRGIKKRPKESEFLQELEKVPEALAEEAIQSRIKKLRKELGGEVSSGIFFMEILKPEGGFIQHNSYPKPDLSLHYFLRTPVNSIEFLECQNSLDEQGGFCTIRDWSIMSHRLKTKTCMVDEETGEELCDTIKNLSALSNEYPYRLLRGKITNDQKIDFLLGQQQQLEMFDVYEEIMKVEGDDILEEEKIKKRIATEIFGEE